MTNNFKIKQNDRYPSFEAILSSTVAFDLSLATSVAFVWRPTGSALRNVGAMTVEDVAAKRVRYDWEAGATAVVGVYDAQVEITFPAGLVMTFPNAGFYTYEVTATI